MNREAFLRSVIVSFLLLFLVACTNSAFTIERQTYSMIGDDAIQARSSDGQAVYVDVTIVFEIPEENLELVQMRFPEGNYIEQLIRPVLRNEVRLIMAENQAQDLFGNFSGEAISPLFIIENELEENVRTALTEEGFTVASVLIRAIDFDESFVNAMEAMQIETLTFRSYEDLQGTATQATINLRNAEATQTATHTP